MDNALCAFYRFQNKNRRNISGLAKFDRLKIISAYCYLQTVLFLCFTVNPTNVKMTELKITKADEEFAVECTVGEYNT